MTAGASVPVLLLALLAGTAHAQGTAAPVGDTVARVPGTATPDRSPLPPERPAAADTPEAPETVPQPSAPNENDAVSKTPAEAVESPETSSKAVESPETSSKAAEPAEAPEPAQPSEAPEPAQPSEAPEPAEPPAAQRLAESELALGICLGRLAVHGTKFERGDAISDDGGACGIANPVRVTEIVPGVTLEPAGIMRCEAAAALADWVDRFVLPASELLPGRGRVTGLANASTYVCRNRDNAAEGPISEHAFGNAVDISAFRFAEGDRIAIQPREREGTPDEAFQRAVRATACLEFTTVLGPGADAAHDDHLHLDVEARESGFRLCQ